MKKTSTMKKQMRTQQQYKLLFMHQLEVIRIHADEIADLIEQNPEIEDIIGRMLMPFFCMYDAEELLEFVEKESHETFLEWYQLILNGFGLAEEEENGNV